MSQTPIVAHLAIPTCRQDRTIRVCVGPPATLPHDIPLPAAKDEVKAQHDAGHHANPDDSPVKCPICAVAATHINTCPTCRATLIRCVRNDCQPAWNPFERLIAPIAANIARRLRGTTPAFIDEAREVAAEKGMKLIYVDPRCDPEKVIAESDRLTGLLSTAMWNQVKSWIDSKDPTREALVADPEDPEDARDSTLLETPVGATGTAAPRKEPSPRDSVLEVVEQADAVAILRRILVDYRDTLDETDQFVFNNWYAKRASGDGPSQEQISQALLQLFDVVEDQPTTNRRIKRFKEALHALFTSPDNGLDEETRTIAHQLFIDNKRIRRSSKSPDSPSADTTEPTTSDSEGHDD